MTALGEVNAPTKMKQFGEYKSKYFKYVSSLQIDLYSVKISWQ